MRNLFLLVAICSVTLPHAVDAQTCRRTHLRMRQNCRTHVVKACQPKSTCCAAPVMQYATQPMTNAVPTEVELVAPPAATPDPAPQQTKAEWRALFDGKTFGEWKPTEFGGEGEVEIKDGQFKLDFGQYMTGVTHSGKAIPKNNYELELEAMREDGTDFFCGLTFPVDESHASFIVGGWGGSVVGISSIDGMDASENSTTSYKPFKNNVWHTIRVRVTKGRLQAWINDELFVDEEVDGSRLGTRIEVDRSKPLGIAAFDTRASIRNIRIREVSEPAEK